jgi:hypothetical protein
MFGWIAGASSVMGSNMAVIAITIGTLNAKLINA